MSYQQQFTFLPGLRRGLSFSANHASLQTPGDFGGTDSPRHREVPQFTPRTGSASLSWRHRGFRARLIVNYSGNYINAFTAGHFARNQYRFKRTITDAIGPPEPRSRSLRQA